MLVKGVTGYTPFTQGAATFVPPLCDHKTDQVAVEGRKEAERTMHILFAKYNSTTSHVLQKHWVGW